MISVELIVYIVYIELNEMNLKSTLWSKLTHTMLSTVPRHIKGHAHNLSNIPDQKIFR